MSNPLHLAGVKIRAHRHKMGLTVAELSAQLSDKPLHEQTIYNWESRGKVARPALQRKLAALGICTANDWLAEAPPAEPQEGARCAAEA